MIVPATPVAAGPGAGFATATVVLVAGADGVDGAVAARCVVAPPVAAAAWRLPLPAVRRCLATALCAADARFVVRGFGFDVAFAFAVEVLCPGLAAACAGTGWASVARCEGPSSAPMAAPPPVAMAATA